MEDKLKEKIELSLLFDFYGELLKNHNKQIFADYILNDLSLGEIAEQQGISRQGVYDIVKRCSKQLKDCENKLCLLKKFEQTKDKVNRIRKLAEQVKSIHQKKETLSTQQFKDKNQLFSASAADSFTDESGRDNSKELVCLLEMIELTEDILQDL
jgi:Uncharacterized protein conserved in bacteria